MRRAEHELAGIAIVTGDDRPALATIFEGLSTPALVAVTVSLVVWQVWAHHGADIWFRMRIGRAIDAWRAAARGAGLELSVSRDATSIQGIGELDALVVRIEVVVISEESELSRRQEGRKVRTSLTVDSGGAIPYDLTLGRMDVGGALASLPPDTAPGQLPDDIAIGGDYDTASRPMPPAALVAITHAVREHGMTVADGEVRWEATKMIDQSARATTLMIAAVSLARALRDVHRG